jgi:catechol 2,3-dioxygenase-like lactoylglutathione lyase family enzyme
MLDHVALNVRDIDASKTFYLKALEPLGYGVFFEVGHHVGLQAGGHPDFWLHQRGDMSGPVHVAFRTDRSAVDTFHAAGIAAGGRDNGPPGLRPQYHEHYYGAFVLDPDGNNIEAVCHEPA